MKKNIHLENLDCAACAAKIERALAGLEGVQSVSVNFMGQRMILEASETDFDRVLERVKKAAWKLERDLEFSA